MDWQAIEAGPTYGGPVFFVDQDTGDMTTAHWAVRYGVLFQRLGASIALSAAHWQPESKTLESSGEKGRAVADAPVTVAVCVLWLFIGAVADNALCGEGDARAQAYVATENGRKIAQANASRDDSLLVSQIVETTVVEQKPILERGRARIGFCSTTVVSTIYDSLLVSQIVETTVVEQKPILERGRARIGFCSTTVVSTICETSKES